MKKHKARHAHKAAYPQAPKLAERRTFLKSMGLASGAVIVGAQLPGCGITTSGIMPISNEFEYLSLPNSGWRKLDRKDDEARGYRLDMQVMGRDVFSFFTTHEEETLDKIDLYLADVPEDGLALNRDLSPLLKDIKDLCNSYYMGTPVEDVPEIPNDDTYTSRVNSVALALNFAPDDGED